MSHMILNMLFCTVNLFRHHTLVMTDSKRVYSFGCGEQDQLGHGEESHPSVPLPVQLPQGNSIYAIVTTTITKLNIKNVHLLQ